ncbi:MAG: glycosyltransferase family 10 [Pseudomonadota bacterium]
MIFFKKKPLLSATHTLPDGRTMIFDAIWPGFQPAVDYAFWVDLLPHYSAADTIRILGPFSNPHHQAELAALRARHGKWDYFITGENRDNPTDLAHKCIGFRLPRSKAEFRFPYWKWYLTWPGFETTPPYARFGGRLSIDQMLAPMADSFDAPDRAAFGAMTHKAVLLTSHFKRHRRSLWRRTHAAMGCDAFGRKVRPTNLAKRDLLAPYAYNLCPENRAAQGYITEKTPEAFLCGCVPITYCHPDDLARDFNPDAVVNLYGQTARQTRAMLTALATDYDLYQSKRAAPLLATRPDLAPLRAFLSA